MARIDLKKLLLQCKQNNLIIKNLQNEIAENKKIFSKYFDKCGKKSFGYNGSSCYIINKIKIDYDIEKIEKKLDKKISNQFIDKNYNLNFDEFKSICKKNKIDVKIFKSALQIDKSVNDDKLNALYDSGAINLEDLDGCYERKESKAIGIRYGEKA